MPRFSAQDVYSILGPHTLTPEQVAAVESASLTEPTLVIAGAGSGKTELMSVRILYLVANEFAKPDEILGLTFTKKAASELSARVLKALYLLRESPMWPKSLEADFLPPKIATYNSFGNEVFRQFAVEVGLEPDSQVLGESASVALARELLRKLSLDDHPELADWDRTAGYLTEKLLSMVQEITDNRVAADDVRDYLMRFESHVSSLPKSEGGSMERFAYTQTFLTEAATNALLAALATKFIELKRERNLVDYADQVSLALDAAETANTDLGYRFVMLDEYQDTSAIQVQFLASLFRGKPVMAVGDPNQSIYGFRGASSANLTGFFEDFGQGETLTLSTCWRSTAQIVDVANLIARPLDSVGIKKIELVANKSGSAVQAHFLQDIEAEAELAASYFASELGDQSGALLMRTKSQMGLFVAALEARGVVTEVSGLSGLIEIPEVLDLISALRVLATSQASVEVIRLLTGPKWRIGIRDIAKLGELAKKLTRIRPEADSSSEVTLVEALDALRFEGAGQNSEFSELGLARLRQAALFFHNLRSTPSLTITELAWMIVRELEIDIELYARSKASNPLRHIEQFISRLAEYETVSNRPSLSGLMQWLDYALEHDSFELPKVGSKRGVVQVMSVHASKGLEWDLVWVAQLTQGAFPIEGKDSKGWLTAGKIPFEIRADGRSLPVFDFASATSQKQLNELFSEFKEANRQRAAQEERRLAYVAFTRAAKKLVLSGSYYKPNAQSPRSASVFLEELRDAGLVDLNAPQALDQNPLDSAEQLIPWPKIIPDVRLEADANAVLSAEATQEITSHELALLFEERDRMRTRQTPDLPTRLSVSRILKLLDDPKCFFEELSRPMPPQYSETAAIGTAFHSYLEAALGEQEYDEETSAFSELIENFENSKFRGQKPVLIEQAIEFELDSLVVVCKLDAVFQDGDMFEVVDWKSGAVPDDQKLESRKVQLAIYRIALSRWLNVPIERIRASFFYAADAVEVSPTGLPSEAELIDRIREARKARLN